jgi:hypothetical protein
MIQGRYGVALTFRAPIIKVGVEAFAVAADWTPASGDCKITKDGANVANVATLPTAVGGSGSALWSWPLSASEMEALEIVYQTVDAAVKDQAFVIGTLPNGALRTGKASAGGAATLTIGTGLPVKAGQLLEIHGGANAGDSRYVLSYDNGTGIVTMDSSWTSTPDNTSLWTLWPSPIPAATSLPAVNLKKINDVTVQGAGVAGNSWRP